MAQDVGVAAAVNQSAFGTRNAEVRTIGLGDNVIYNERIDTNSDGLVQLLLADGTTFTVGPNSSLVIDSFVYNPDAGTAQVAATLTKGVLRFIGAATSKTPDGVAISTPVGVVGIRGGVTDINMSPPDGVPPHISMIFGNSVTLTGDQGQLLGRLFEAGFSLVATGGGIDTMKTPPAWASQIQQALTSSGNQTGGAPSSATNSDVTTVAAVNSDLTSVIPPIPADPIDRPTDLGDQIIGDATGDGIPDDNGGDPGPVVVSTANGTSAGVLNLSAFGPGVPTESQTLGLLGLPFGPNGAVTEIGYDASGAPVAGVITLYFADCVGCTVTLDTAADTFTFFDDTLTPTPVAFPVDSTIIDHTAATLPTNVTYCTCAFLDWGLWEAHGGFNYLGYGFNIDAEGQWTSGDVTTPAELDELAATRTVTATYEGSAIGTVDPDITASGGTYLAAGDLAMTWNFGTRNGQLDITGYDGRDFGGTIAAPPSGDGFVGDLGFGVAPPTGEVVGVFANDGDQLGAGIMGDFEIDDGHWGTTGIIIGQEVP
jgi:hypothetical protein